MGGAASPRALMPSAPHDGPPEHPPDHADVAGTHLVPCVLLIGVLIPVVAAQPDAAARQAIDEFHPQQVVMLQGVDLAVDDRVD